MPAVGDIFGHKVTFAGEVGSNGRWIHRDSKGRFISDKNLKCPKCGKEQTAEGHDPCIANLPGVKNACCGHGNKKGYVMFENGLTIRGFFEVEKE
jgi:hypothetical protein